MQRSVPVSVVIPSHNRASTIGAAIRTVLCQSYCPAEIVVVDDGSEDDTAEVVRAIDSPILRYVRQERSGANAARNRGVNESRSEFVAFQDSDDLWIPNKLELQWQRLSASGSDASFGRFIKVGDAGARILPLAKRVPQVADVIRKKAFHKNFLSTQTLLIRKETLTAIGGFDVRLKRFQDWDVLLRLVGSVAFEFHWEPLAIVNDTTGSITRNYSAGLEARTYILAKYSEDYARRRMSHALARRDLALRRIAATLMLR